MNKQEISSSLKDGAIINSILYQNDKESDFHPGGEDLKLGFRKPVRGDEGIIFDPWLKGIQSLSSKHLYPRVFLRLSQSEMANHVKTIKVLLNRSNVILACESDHPDQIFGWIVAEMQGKDQVLHMLYVRNTFRRLKIATSLLNSVFPSLKIDPIYCTYPTKRFKFFEKRWLLKYNPYRIIKHED